MAARPGVTRPRGRGVALTNPAQNGGPPTCGAPRRSTCGAPRRVPHNPPTHRASPSAALCTQRGVPVDHLPTRAHRPHPNHPAPPDSGKHSAPPTPRTRRHNAHARAKHATDPTTNPAAPRETCTTHVCVLCDPTPVGRQRATSPHRSWLTRRHAHNAHTHNACPHALCMRTSTTHMHNAQRPRKTYANPRRLPACHQLTMHAPADRVTPPKTRPSPHSPPATRAQPPHWWPYHDSRATT